MGHNYTSSVGKRKHIIMSDNMYRFVCIQSGNNLIKIDKAYVQKPINKQKSETFGLHLQYKLTDGLRQTPQTHF